MATTRDEFHLHGRGRHTLPAYALQAATIHAAEVLGVDRPSGSWSKPGKRADIIAMPGDPLADIQA